MVLKIDDYKKKIPNEAQKRFINFARRVRVKDYPEETEVNALPQFDRDNLKALIEATRDDGESGFDIAWKTLSVGTRLSEWTKLVTEVSAPEWEPQPKKTLVNFADLRNRPRPQWVIQDFIYENTIIELHAEAGCYKSFLAFDWSARIATGTDWLGHIKTNKQGTVVYIAAEGADGYISRGDAWCYHNNIPFDDLAKNFFFWPDALPLTNSAEITRFIDEVTETLSNGDTPRFIVIDTLLRCSNGENINSPDVMGSIFMGAAKIKEALKVPNILIVHHAGKDSTRGAMGSVVLRNNCDCIYSMSKDAGTPGQVILKAEKMKDKAEPQIILRSQKIYYGDVWDEENASLVLIEGEKALPEEKPAPDSQTDLLDIIDEFGDLGYTELFKKWHVEGKRGYSSDNFKKILREMQANKILEKVGDKYKRYVATKSEQMDNEDDSEVEND